MTEGIEMNFEKKLSVIIPVYNLEKYVEECIRSAAEQVVNFSYEIIVSDDSSSDRSTDIISRLANEFPALIFPIFKPVNQGLAENMLTLVKATRGQYIAYLDGDDVMLSGKLQSQVDYLELHPKCSLIFHESDMFDSSTNETIKEYSKGYYNWHLIPDSSDVSHMIKYGVYMQASAIMFRNHGRITQSINPDCKIIMDYSFYVAQAAMLGGSIDFVDKTLSRYRIHPDSFGAQTQRSTQRRIQSLDDLCLACLQTKQWGVEENIINEGVAHHQYSAALYFLRKDDVALFHDLINKSVSNGFYFDKRHEYCFNNLHEIEKVKAYLWN